MLRDFTRLCFGVNKASKCSIFDFTTMSAMLASACFFVVFGSGCVGDVVVWFDLFLFFFRPGAGEDEGRETWGGGLSWTSGRFGM